jgi:alkylhydroperoxidase family enzyme
MSNEEQVKFIDDFEAHYQYDSTYMRELLAYSPEGFAKFVAFLPLSDHREVLSLNSFWVAKLAAMQVCDCGHCVQLNIRMALEAGVDKDIVKASIYGGSKLPEDLKDVYDFATSVASAVVVDPVLEQRINEQFDKAQLMELGVCIATVSIFPTIKRALGYTKSCSLVEFKI